MSNRSLIPVAEAVVGALQQVQPDCLDLPDRSASVARELVSRLCLLHQHFDLPREVFLRWTHRLTFLTGTPGLFSDAFSLEPSRDFFSVVRSHFVFIHPGVYPEGGLVLLDGHRGIAVKQGRLQDKFVLTCFSN